MKPGQGIRTRIRSVSPLAKVVALLLVMLAVSSPLAYAQDATPEASPMASPIASPSAMGEGETLVRSMNPAALPTGFTAPGTVTHITNYGVHEWYQNLTKGEAARAQEYGITFNQVDANLDLQASLAAVQEVAPNVDVINFTPVQEEASGETITKIAAETAKPIICESSPTAGCTTLVSIDDYSAGFKVGVWAGNYVNENMDGQANILDVGLPGLNTTVNRSQGFVDGITSILGENAKVAQSVDGQGLKDKAVVAATDALTANPDVNVIFGINDDSALGGLQAFESQGGDTANLLVVGFGCEGNACKDALAEGGPYKVSLAMFPEYQGRLLIDAGVAALNGVALPGHIVAPTTPITADNLGQFYTAEGDVYAANFDAIAQISVAGEK